MDLVMPRMGGAEATRRLLEQHPHLKVLALTSFVEQELVRDALQAGAIGYLLKNASAEELATAIRSAHAGEPTVAPEVLQALLHLAREEPQPDYGLSERESEVLNCMAAGLNNREIAEQLVVTRSTVKAHVSSILSKMGVSNRTEAIALAMKVGLVT